MPASPFSSNTNSVLTTKFVPFIVTSLVPLLLSTNPRSIWSPNATSCILNVLQSSHSLSGFVTYTSCAAAVAFVLFSK